jgi:hypothetical protein
VLSVDRAGGPGHDGRNDRSQDAVRLPDEIDPVFLEDDHEASFSLIAASLLLPYLEPPPDANPLSRAPVSSL